jgi:hypothetical protein
VSAAPSSVPQPPKQAICKTPLSMFEAILGICNFTQVKCFGHVLNAITSPGPGGKAHAWIRIRPSEFAEIARTTEEWAMAAVDSLIRSKLLEVEYSGKGTTHARYRIAPDLTAESNAKPIRGRCKECQWIGMFATEFIPMPRTFFTKLMPAVDHATFVCVAVVARFTHHWSAERGLWIEPSELNMHDFRLTGLEPGMVKQGLDRAVELGLIKRRNRAGKASIYESCPDNWTAIEKRPLREITPPQRGAKDQAKEVSSSSTEKPTKPPETPIIESGRFRTAICPKCERVVEVETIADDLQIPEVLPAEDQLPKKPPRAAPSRETRTVNRQDEATEVLKGWWERARSGS